MKHAFLFIMLVVNVAAFSYPIQPRPLRKLIQESEFIIYGTVIRIGKAKPSPSRWESDVAVILIKEVLQGRIKADSIKVYYSSGMICPAPPQYYEGTDIIVFLDRDKKQKDVYYTHALSYGVKNCFIPDAYTIYKSRITEMQQILTLQDETEQQEEVIRWLVKCAVNPFTRWDGLYELSPKSDFMSYYDHSCDNSLLMYLTQNDKDSLAIAFSKIDDTGYEDLGLADIVVTYNRQLVFDVLKKNLIALEEDNKWYLFEIMQRLAMLSGDNELEKISKQYEPLRYNYDDKQAGKKMERLLLQFIERLKKAELKKLIVVNGEFNS